MNFGNRRGRLKRTSEDSETWNSGRGGYYKSGNELSLDLHKSGNELSLDLHNLVMN